jgi:hypothetical protein
MKRPAINIRFRSKRELAKIKRAAKLDNMSLNQFVIGRVSNAADDFIRSKEMAAAIIAADDLADSEDFALSGWLCQSTWQGNDCVSAALTGRDTTSRLGERRAVGESRSSTVGQDRALCILLEAAMTVLEGNQAYRAAMTILADARRAVYNANDLWAHGVLCRAQNHLTTQEQADMKASFAEAV